MHTRIFVSLAAMAACSLCMAQSAIPRFRHVPSRAELESRQKTDSLSAYITESLFSTLPPFYFTDEEAYVPTAALVFDTDIVDALPDGKDLNVSFEDFTGVFKGENLNKGFAVRYSKPLWLTEAKTRWTAAKRLRYKLMTGPKSHVDFLSWELPEPPKLMPLAPEPTPPALVDIPEAEMAPETEMIAEIKKKHWLHILDAGLQFSQAYVSPNWYQGGDNNVNLLINFRWNVALNKNYHPNLLFESNLQYKLGLYSTPHDEYHNYAISEDLLQWNVTTGLKAFKKWYYSFNMQFKTQFLNNYGANSEVRKASFLSPGELNMGIGMTYSTENKKKGITFLASLAPVSYNLKTCIDRNVDPTQFNIKEGRKSVSEIGSNGELTLNWQLTTNITWRSRLFLFTNYKYFYSDWENTFSFSINRFLSTQIYIHGRYDTSVDTESKGWKKWMLKEILSFGISYTFTTVPPKK